MAGRIMFPPEPRHLPKRWVPGERYKPHIYRSGGAWWVFAKDDIFDMAGGPYASPTWIEHQ